MYNQPVNPRRYKCSAVVEKKNFLVAEYRIPYRIRRLLIPSKCKGERNVQGRCRHYEELISGLCGPWELWTGNEGMIEADLNKGAA